MSSAVLAIQEVCYVLVACVGIAFAALGSRLNHTGVKWCTTLAQLVLECTRLGQTWATIDYGG